MEVPRLVIAGTESGVGKTTISIGIMAALRNRGLKVQPFKVGPDFLDPSYHRMVAGRPSQNLDGWMTGRRYVTKRFLEASKNSDLSLVEGVMGLFDGYGATSEEGSTAQMAKWLSAPVILVIHAKGMSRSAAALVLGYAKFDRKLKVAGIIFNRVGSPRHLNLLKDAVESNVGIPVVGGIPREDQLKLPERHLGLSTAQFSDLDPLLFSTLAETMEKHLDLDFLVNTARSSRKISVRFGKEKSEFQNPKCRMGIAYDEAFHFYYPDNLDQLKSQGAELIFFSPIKDKTLPEHLDGLYFGGGYPELFAEPLSKNFGMREEIRRFVERGGVVYAECGGLMYMTRGIEFENGRYFEMVGAIPSTCRFLPTLRRLGYVEITSTSDNVLGKSGWRFRGHEFHYSEMCQSGKLDGVETVYLLNRKDQTESRTEGFQFKNLLASYVHVHFGSNPKLAGRLVRECKKRHGKMNSIVRAG